MKKIHQAEEDEKKQERQNQKSRYQEALPVIQSVIKVAFIAPMAKINYPRLVTPKLIQRAYSILLPPQNA